MCHRKRDNFIFFLLFTSVLLDPSPGAPSFSQTLSNRRQAMRWHWGQGNFYTSSTMGNGMFESRRSPSFWGELTTPLLWLLLGLFLLPEPGTCQPSCPAPETPQRLMEHQYETVPNLNLDSAFMSGIVQSFLDLVQPNPFPKGESFHLEFSSPNELVCLG